MKRPRILIVGGGANQARLVDEANRRGFVTVVTDINQSPPGKVLADFFYQIDTTNKSENLKIARFHEINAVVTDQSDAAVPTTSYVAEQLNLPGIKTQTARLFTNKSLMREVLSQSLPHLSPSHFASFSDHLSALRYLQTLGEKLDQTIVKPIDSQGSKGVSRLLSSNPVIQLNTAFGESRSGSVILEEFVEGTEYCIDSVVIGGKATSLAIGRKEHYISNECLDQRISFDGSFTDECAKSLVGVNQQVITALGLHTGLAHAEFIANEKRILVVEIAARGGGSGIANTIVPHISGFNTTSFLLDFVTGIRPLNVGELERTSRSAILHFFQPNSEVVKFLRVGTGARELVSELHLIQVEEHLKFRPTDSRNRLGYFIVVGENYQEACEREAAVLSQVSYSDID